MKPLKYTVAALALIAVASFNQSAKAASPGDVILGLGNSSTSVEFDLGAFSTLTANESFNLGTTISSTLGTSGVTFDIGNLRPERRRRQSGWQGSCLYRERH